MLLPMSPRTHEVHAAATAVSKGDVTMTVIRFQQRILDAARQIAASPTADGPTLAAAVVIAHTACEVATERALRRLIASRNVGPLADAIEDFVWRYDLCDKKVRRLWNTLSGDQIQDRPLWDRYQTHIKRRNKAAHSGVAEDGKQMTKKKAEDSIEVAGLFLAHIEQVLNNNGLGQFA